VKKFLDEEFQELDLKPKTKDGKDE